MPWWYCALRDTDSPVHVVGSILEKSVEVNASTRIPKVIVNVEDQPVPDHRFNQRYWPFPVDADGGASKRPVRIGDNPSNMKVPNDCLRGDKLNKQDQTSQTV